MDPITALGVAGSIFQLVDFGIKIVSKGNKIYHSADGSTALNHDLENVANDLILIQTRLSQYKYPSGANDPWTEDDQALADLGVTSTQVAEALLLLLNKAKAQGRFRRWKSLRQAMKSVTSKSDVDDLARRLLMLRDQFNLRILIGLKKRFDIASLEQSRECEQLHRTSKDVLQALKHNHTLFTQEMETKAAATSKRHDTSEALIVKTGENIIALVERLAHNWEEAANLRKDTIRHSEKEPSQDLVGKAVLKSLLYPTIEFRRETIVEAHAKTFQWIFQDPKEHNKPWSNFTTWLRYQNDIYWVNGKAASGKSTLMKYLGTHPEVKRHLATWAQGRSLVSAHFFFWNLGTPLQKSQAGLLRSLLHQALSQHKHMIPQVMPDLWNDMSRRRYDFLKQLPESWYSWSLPELRQLLEDLFTLAAKSIKFCFFIDGLDEFDGDHVEIISFLRHISSNLNLKLCISSRPLLVFDQAFAECSRLCLQDLTVDDIKLYIRDRLNDHKAMFELQREEPESIKLLVQEIVDMSSGVFLWVTIVTRSLLEGLTNLDGISDLQKRLRDLPPELDDLFGHMLRSIKPTFYLEQASRLFQIVFHSHSPPSTVELSFADDEDITLPFKPGFRDLCNGENVQRDASMTARLKSRCAGLLEVHLKQVDSDCFAPNAQTEQSAVFMNEVNYLHLTVKEFLEKPDVWSTVLKCTAGTSFNAHVSLLRASIVTLKTDITRDTVYRPGSVLGEILSSSYHPAMEYAALAEDSTGQAQVALLDELDRTTQHYLRDKHGERVYCSELASRHEVWSGLASGCYLSHCTLRKESFLASAIYNGLVLYSKVKLSGRVQTVNNSACVPLLNLAMASQWDERKFVLRIPMLQFLLQEGLDPNGGSQISSNGSQISSPWWDLLEHLNNRIGSALDLSWFKTCKLFLSYGANPSETFRKVCPSGVETTVSALQIIRKAFVHLPLGHMAELEAMFFHRGVLTTTRMETNRKRKAPENNRDRVSARRKVCHFRVNGDANIFRDQKSETSSRWSVSGPGGEPLAHKPADWSNWRGPTSGRIPAQGFSGGHDASSYYGSSYQQPSSPWPKPSSGYETFRYYQDTPQWWQGRDQGSHAYGPQQGQFERWRVQRSVFDRDRNLGRLPNAESDSDDVMHRHHRDQGRQQREWEYSERTYNSRYEERRDLSQRYDHYSPPRSTPTSASYHQPEPYYPRYHYDGNPATARRAETRLERYWDDRPHRR